MSEPAGASAADRASGFLGLSPEEEEETPSQPDRMGRQWLVPVLVFVVYLVAPLIIIPTLGQQGAVVPMIVTLFATAAVAGLVDGYTFRPSPGLMTMVGVAFLAARVLYFNDDTTVYLIALVATSGLCSMLGHVLPGARRVEPQAPQRGAVKEA